MTPPPALMMEDLVEEVLLRLPPYDPKNLVRAALVCTAWRRLIAAPGFRRRFRELHRAPPMLGALICHHHDEFDAVVSRFIPTGPFKLPLTRTGFTGQLAIDSRHGRVLFHTCAWDYVAQDHSMCLWDPVADEELRLPRMPLDPNPYQRSWTAAVLCAAAGGCDHLDCARGPFLVVFVCAGRTATFARVYSSEDGAWSDPTYAPFIKDFFEETRGALVGDALHFMLDSSSRVLKYNVTTREITVIQLPITTASYPRHHIVLMTTESGELGFARAEGSRLCLWSRDGDAGWAQRVVELDTLLPVDALSRPPRVVGFADGVGLVFIATNVGLFSIDLNNGQVRKVSKRGDLGDSVAPIMSFYFPALEAVSRSEGPRVSALKKLDAGERRPLGFVPRWYL